MNAKPVRFSAHAKQQLGFRGVREIEVVEAIRTAAWTSAELLWLESAKDFPFRSEWHGVYYETKRVRPIFVDEPGEIVVVTVYAYYF